MKNTPSHLRVDFIATSEADQQAFLPRFKEYLTGLAIGFQYEEDECWVLTAVIKPEWYRLRSELSAFMKAIAQGQPVDLVAEEIDLDEFNSFCEGMKEFRLEI